MLVSQQLIPVAAQRGASGQIQLLANAERDEVGRSQTAVDPLDVRICTETFRVLNQATSVTR